MWIFCCGMPRSGSTLQFQITAQLIEEAGLGKRIETVRPTEFGKLRKQYAADPAWKVFKAHTCTDKMEKEFQRQNAAGVYVYRDLRDVVLSTMRKSEKTFDELWDMGFLEDRFEEYRRWTALPRVLVSRYETIIADLPAEVQRIAAHLGMALSAEAAQRIAADHSLERQRERIAAAVKNGDLRAGVVQGIYYNPTTNLHANHIHEGAIGGWKKVLSREQVERLEAKAGDWLLAHYYELACEN